MNPAGQNELLNSWKEIAAYLNRGVRTVQRWERELGLPVRRPRAKNRSAVIAMRSDIDAWLKHCPVTERREQSRTELALKQLPPIASVVAQSHELRQMVHDSQAELGVSLSRLMATLEKMVGERSF